MTRDLARRCNLDRLLAVLCRLRVHVLLGGEPSMSEMPEWIANARRAIDLATPDVTNFDRTDICTLAFVSYLRGMADALESDQLDDHPEVRPLVAKNLREIAESLIEAA